MEKSKKDGNFKFDKLKIELPTQRQLPPNFGETELCFGKTFCDIMVVCDWSIESGWGKPEIIRMGNFNLSPACSVFHYGTCCFEGMKAFKKKDKILLFRPLENMIRLNSSSRRICLPEIPEKECLKIIAFAVKLCKDWIPDIAGHSLYIRPTMIGTQAEIGVKPSEKARFFCLFSPVSGYYQGECNLLVDTRFIRAFEKGTGQWKIGGNYAPTILPQYLAKKRGFNQLLWVGIEGEIQEVGTMNLFVHWERKNGEEEIITAPLTLGTILPGITRDTVIKILKKWGKNIREQVYYLKELIEAFLDNRVKEVFGTGTAVMICLVHSITVGLERYECHPPKEGMGKTLKKELIHIQRGESKIFSEFSVDVEDILK